MTAFFKTILEMSATAAVVILVVLVIRLLLKKAPRKYSYALWAAAAFRLVCPVSFRSVFSIFALTERVKLPEGGQTVPPPVTTLAPDVAVTMPPAAITQPPAVVTTPPAISVTPPAVTEPVTSVVSFWDVAAVIWLIVLAGLLIYGVVSYVRLRRRMANAVLLEGNVYRSDRVCSPFILGFVRPRIYLPFGLTEEQQAYVLAHEGHHLRRLDHIVRPVAFLILAFHWFNPLVWAAYYLMGRDMEMSCDEKVLGGAENIRKAYSMTLLSFAANRRFPSPGPLAFGETGVKGRIKNVLNWKKPALWVTIIAVIVVIAVLLVCAADPSVPASAPEIHQWMSTVTAEDVTHIEAEGEGTSGVIYGGENQYLDPLGNQKVQVLVNWLNDVPEDALKEDDGREWRHSVTVTCGEEQYVLRLSDGDLGIGKGSSVWIIDEDTGLDKKIRNLASSVLGEDAVFGWETYRNAERLYINPELDMDTYPDYIADGKHNIGIQYIALYLYTASNEVGYGFPERMGPWEPLTEKRWNKLFQGEPPRAFEQLNEPMIRTAGQMTYLLRVDGELWLIGTSGALTKDEIAQEVYRLEKEERADFDSPTGWYRSVECVFMNGLSSWIPMDGNSGYTYGIEGDTLTLVHNGSLPTLGDSAGHTYHHAAEGGWQVLTEEKWGEMTDDTLILSGSTLWETIGKYEERYIRRYENRYFLLSLDGEVWLGRDSVHPNGQRYIWDLYRLTPADDPAITVENKLSLSADLNRSGGADLITVSYDHVNETYRLEISESYGMATLLEWEFHRMDTANGGYYLYTREGKDYLLWWAPYSQQGVWNLRYEVISFDEKGGHVVLAQGERKYDASHIGMEHLTADLDDLRSFEREVNALLANSVPLLVNQTADGGGILIGGQGGPILWMSPADEWEKARQEQAYTVTPLVDSVSEYAYTRFELTLGGKTVTFEGTHMADQDILTHYIDVTGDSVADPVIFLAPGMGGTGSLRHELHIFDGKTLEEFPNLKDTVWLCARNAYTFSADGNNFYIKAAGLDVALSKADILSYWADNPAYADINFLDTVNTSDSRLAVKNGMLCVISRCDVGDYWQHYGHLETYLAIDGRSLSVVKAVYVTPDGREITQQTALTTLASLPEHGLYLYTQPDSWRPMLRYGEYSVELDTAVEIGRNPVQFFPGDRNGDGITEIVMLYHMGWGTGYDAFGLMACWVDDDGLHVEYHDSTAIREEFNSNNTFSYDETRNVISVTYGDQSLSLRLPNSFGQPDWGSFQPALVTSGDIARYTAIGENRWQLTLDPGLSDGTPVLRYLPMSVNCTIEFTGTEFRTVEPPTLTAQEDGMQEQAYASFLNGSRSAVNAHSGESFVFSEFSRQVTPDETFRFEPTQYALVDLDGDGGQEMLLDVTNIGSMVLRFDGERICAFFFAGRQFSDVKTDGTFSASGGYADVSICRISFSGKDYEVDEFTCCRSDGETVSFFVDHEPATEEEWLSAFDAWQQREGVQWFDLP